MTQKDIVEPVLFSRPEAHIAVVTLNRPDKKNAVNPALSDALEQIVEVTEADKDIRVVILTSSSDDVFCAGADLGAIASGGAQGISTPSGGFGGLVNFPRQKPWIAAVEGKALGGGCELCLACEMIVASESASFGLPEVKRGLIAAAGGLQRALATLPRNIAYELAIVGDAADAVYMERFGFVNRLVAAGETMGVAMEIAQRIASNGPLAVQLSLSVMRSLVAHQDGAGRIAVADRFAALRRSEDFLEGVRAFLEKRIPIWKCY